MLLLAALAAALQSAAAPTPIAAGPDVFADFERLCVAHRGDLQAPIAAADALGWREVPAAILATMPASVKDAQGRAQMGSGGLELVFTGDGDFGQSGAKVHAKACFVAAQPGAYADVTGRAAALAKVPAAADQAGKQTIYAFTDDGAGHRAVDLKDQAATLAAMKSGAATILMVQSIQGGAGVLLGYAVPTP